MKDKVLTVVISLGIAAAMAIVLLAFSVAALIWVRG